MSIKNIVISRDNDPAGDLHATHFSNHYSTLVILCHGFPGDRHEGKRFDNAGEKLMAAGWDALSFDFSGAGENSRIPVTLTQRIKDVEDVAQWARDHGYSKLATIGLSFGGISSLLAHIPDRNAAVFWAPGFFMKKAAGRFLWTMAKIIRPLGIFPIKQKSKTAFGSGNLVDYSFFESISAHPVEPVLKAFLTPSLIIQGLADKVIRPKYTRYAFSLMPQDSHHQYLEVPGANHEFYDQQDYFIQSSIDFLTQYLDKI